MYKPVENRFDGISDEHITSRDPDRWFRFRQRFYTLNGMTTLKISNVGKTSTGTKAL